MLLDPVFRFSKASECQLVLVDSTSKYSKFSLQHLHNFYIDLLLGRQMLLLHQNHAITKLTFLFICNYK